MKSENKKYIRTEDKTSRKGVEQSTARGMHGSKGQGGRNFDREKEEDKFLQDETRMMREEETNNKGSSTVRGGTGAEGKKESHPLTYYSGSQGERGEPNKEGTKNIKLKNVDD